ncbi:MAG: hypothetical protein JNN15_01265 [Blastocatellia bacterium]|nr:hypothetical protein [Blastocatellia bacterium]
MSVFESRKEDLEKYEFMMGKQRGRLAVSMDILTDALTLVGMHAVYCRNSRFPDRPKMDIEQVIKNIEETKELISSVIKELKQKTSTES